MSNRRRARKAITADDDVMLRGILAFVGDSDHWGSNIGLAGKRCEVCGVQATEFGAFEGVPYVRCDGHMPDY